MSELLHVQVIDTGEERTITDAEPLVSAQHFLELSNRLWERKPPGLLIDWHSSKTVVPAKQAKEAVDQTLKDITPALVLSGLGQPLKLTSSQGKEVSISSGLLNHPTEAHIGTYKWDGHNDKRDIELEGRKVAVQFTDSHRDYSRKLFAGFSFSGGGEELQLEYSMMRAQHEQAEPTFLFINLWHTQQTDKDYKSHCLEAIELSVEQELAVLNTWALIGGVALAAK